ncbi:sporulation histidine kinase inhibitor Sda [Bacillus niameyensis]|nr:sporulation histidine kinase inhibitor Sda [Bacillus niameyensis]
MDRLSNQSLVETYLKAKRLGLSESFIQLLLEEMNKRNLKDEEMSLTC